MPDAPAPDTLPSETERLKDILDDPRFPKRAREWLEMRINEVRFLGLSYGLFLTPL